MAWIIFFFVTILVLWTIAALYLDGDNYSQYDDPVGEVFDDHPDDNQANMDFLSSIKKVRQKTLASKSLKKSLVIVRQFADNLSADMQPVCTFTPVKQRRNRAHVCTRTRD